MKCTIKPNFFAGLRIGFKVYVDGFCCGTFEQEPATTTDHSFIAFYADYYTYSIEVLRAIADRLQRLNLQLAVREARKALFRQVKAEKAKHRLIKKQKLTKGGDV